MQCVWLVLAAALCPAQSIGVGVKGGLPLSDFLAAESKTGALTNVVRARGDYLIGPMFDLRLPANLGIELDLLYRRWTPESVAGAGAQSALEFPLIGKFRFPTAVARPYIAAGANFQRLGDVAKFVTGNTVESNRRGIIAGGGIEFKALLIRIAPELRWTRWNATGPVRSSNQVDFLIGLTF
jgi:hypothetical protein